MLDASIYDSLSRLQLQMSHKSSLNMSGNRKSVQKGISAEFSDFREYMPGDDLRRMDWNVYARLDKLYIREYMEEKEAVVSVLIDTSASMDYGGMSKAELARDLAAVVSFLALNNMDRLVLYDMKDMSRGLSVGGGRNAFAKVLRWLEKLSFSGEVDMLSAARKVQYRGPGVTVIISDFLHEGVLVEAEETGNKSNMDARGIFRKNGNLSEEDVQSKARTMFSKSGKVSGVGGKFLKDGEALEAGGVSEAGVMAKSGRVFGYEKLLQYLNYCKQRPVILHTMAEEELRISLEGTLNLIDVETDSRLRLTVDAKAIEHYERELGRFMERLKKGCSAGRGAYVLCDTGKDKKKLVFEDLRVIYDI